MEGFQFNLKSKTEQFLKSKVAIQLDEKVCLNIKFPAIDVKNDFVWVAEASHSHIHIWVGAVDPKS